MQLISVDGPTRDEIDFEFLGGNKERPHILHTNIFTNGQGGREQQFQFWFDPTADFHDYAFLWNEKQLVYVIIISFLFSLFLALYPSKKIYFICMDSKTFKYLHVTFVF